MTLVLLLILAASEANPAGPSWQTYILSIVGSVAGALIIQGYATKERRVTSAEEREKAAEKKVGEVAERAVSERMGGYDRRLSNLETDMKEHKNCVERDMKTLVDRVQNHEVEAASRFAGLQVSIERNFASKQDLQEFRRESKEDNAALRKSMHDVRGMLHQALLKRQGEN